MEDFPEDWKKCHITMIPKEGDITNCYYYRGISLLSAPGRAQNNTLKIKNAASSGQPAKEQSWKIMN